MQRSSGVFSYKIANGVEMSTDANHESSLDQIVATLSIDRLSPYLSISQGNIESALNLYKWNIEISAAFYEALSIAEVGLRNTLHAQLTSLNQGLSGNWYDNNKGILVGPALNDISVARKRATRPGRSETPGRVVSELNFGFWKYLLAKRYETTLWTPALRHGFPGLVHKDRATVFKTVEELHSLRNRIAHHEPIHHRDLAKDSLAAYRLIEWISPETREWAASFSRIQRYLSDTPLHQRFN